MAGLPVPSIFERSIAGWPYSRKLCFSSMRPPSRPIRRASSDAGSRSARAQEPPPPTDAPQGAQRRPTAPTQRSQSLLPGRPQRPPQARGPHARSCRRSPCREFVMANKMLIDASHPEETRVVVVRGSKVEEFDFESATRRPLRGNIYLAKVTRVEPSLQAAFVDYGGNRHGFLAFSEIHPDYYQIPKEDREALLREEAEHAAEEERLRAAEESRYDDRGEDEVLEAEDSAPATAESAESASDENAADELRRKRQNLRRRYKIQDVIRRRQVLLVQVVKEERGNKGAALTTYLSLAGRYCVLMPNSGHGGGISRKISSAADRKRLKEVVVEGEGGYRAAREFMKLLMPSHVRRVKQYADPVPLFQRYGAEDQLSAMYDPVVQLKSGGYLVINPTEALVSIDINPGRSTKADGFEATALNTNLEAAREIPRQLRLRDMDGLVVIDFIGMEYGSNVRKVEKAMKEALKNDRARIQVGRISGFGLMEMSRQRLRTGVLEASTRPCAHCDGTGLMRTASSAGLSALRMLEDEAARGRGDKILLRAGREAAVFVLNKKRSELADIEQRYGVSIEIARDESSEAAGVPAGRSGPRPTVPPRVAAPA